MAEQYNAKTPPGWTWATSQPKWPPQVDKPRPPEPHHATAKPRACYDTIHIRSVRTQQFTPLLGSIFWREAANKGKASPLPIEVTLIIFSIPHSYSFQSFREEKALKQPHTISCMEIWIHLVLTNRPTCAASISVVFFYCQTMFSSDNY